MKIGLFDADGVLTLPEEMFSQIYARTHGMNPERFSQFFQQQFPAAIVGEADLKELIELNREVWEYDGDIDVLLEQWFSGENIRNEELLSYVQELRAKGTPCYLATNQEKYRGAYMKEKMFPGEFDGFFVSAELGVKKPDAAFYEKVIMILAQKHAGLQPSDIVFFDDTMDNIDGAKQLGIDAHYYEHFDQVKQLLG